MFHDSEDTELEEVQEDDLAESDEWDEHEDSDEPESDETGFVCAGCGQWNETTVDASAGRRQSYVEDCQVCCKPNVLRIAWDQSEEAYRIESELES